MSQVVIENPVINSPFAEPARHFRFSDEGITDELVDGRRSSAYFVPIARPRKRGGQLVFDTEWTQERIQENALINHGNRHLRTEVAHRYGDAWIANALREANDQSNVWTDTVVGGFLEDKVYVVQTSPKVVARCLLMTTDPGDLVLDPTCGSGTTAFVAEQWGRRWITCDTSRVALALARTRLMAARYPYYLLADSPEGAQGEMTVGSSDFSRSFGETTKVVTTMTMGDIRKGFVYKRVPHVTLKSIANNDEIDAIHARWQEQLEPLRADLNAALGQAWEEWQVPCGLPALRYRHQRDSAPSRG